MGMNEELGIRDFADRLADEEGWRGAARPVLEQWLSSLEDFCENFAARGVVEKVVFADEFSIRAISGALAGWREIQSDAEFLEKIALVKKVFFHELLADSL